MKNQVDENQFDTHSLKMKVTINKACSALTPFLL